MKEFNLSDKIEYVYQSHDDTYVIDVENVKEFIRLLKDKILSYSDMWGNMKEFQVREQVELVFEELAGDKLK